MWLLRRASGQTYEHTDRVIAKLCSHPGGEVITRKNESNVNSDCLPEPGEQLSRKAVVIENKLLYNL